MLKLHQCYCGKPVVVNHKEFKIHKLQCNCGLDIAAYLTGKELSKYFALPMPEPTEFVGAVPTPATTPVWNNVPPQPIGAAKVIQWEINEDDQAEEFTF